MVGGFAVRELHVVGGDWGGKIKGSEWWNGKIRGKRENIAI